MADDFDPNAFKLGAKEKWIFTALILSMFAASVNQTIVGPAMPRIIAELGGMEHYSWVATTALLSSALVTPIIGKLSDMYGRRKFFIGGLIVFIIGCLLSGAAQNFGWLLGARALTGAGMGTLIPLSQTIIGDIIPSRMRGKYQGYMGGAFGVATVIGPLVGGTITDAFGWRWLFYCALPISLIALFVMVKRLKLDHTPQQAKIDILGMVLLSISLTTILLATSWGGSTYPWISGQILGLYIVGIIAGIGFVFAERRAQAPVLPLRLFKNSIFTLSTFAAMLLAMTMFSALTYLPIYVQGVLGATATVSGFVLMPMSVVQILTGIIVGRFITRTGHYKEFMIVGVFIIAAGIGMLTIMTPETSLGYISLSMIVFGLGLGMVMQQYMLVVQNAVPVRDLGVGTAGLQFFRNIGSTTGIAIFGTIMNTGLQDAIASHLPKNMGKMSADVNAGSVLDTSVLNSLPPEVADAVRFGLADRLYWVFLGALPIIAVMFLFTISIKALPLRESVEDDDDARNEYLVSMASTTAADAQALAEFHSPRKQEQLLGMEFEMLERTARRADYPLLERAVTELGNGDFERGLSLLRHTAAMLKSTNLAQAAEEEKYAAEISELASRKGGAFSAQLRSDYLSAADIKREIGQGAAPKETEITVAEASQRVNVKKLREVRAQLAGMLLVDLAGVYYE